MLRLLLLLVLLGNAVVYGWMQGWFAPGWPPPRAHEREPDRLAAQLRPELVTVLPTPAARAAPEAAPVAAPEAAALCLQAGPFGDVELAAAEATLLAAPLPARSWARVPVPPRPWLVSAGRPADAAARRAREEELRRLNLPFEVLEPPAAPAALAGTLVLSRHASREAAEQALATQAGPAGSGLRGARVLELPNLPPRFWLRAERADAGLQERLRTLPPQALAGGFSRCD